MKQELTNFLQNPNRETFLALRVTLLVHPNYAPHSKDLIEIEAALFAKEPEKAQSLLRSAQPNLLLSPRAHLFAAVLARGRGEQERVEMETFFANACAQGILSTGDGSKQSPYLVLRVEDERDVLKFLEKKLRKQSLLHQDNKHLDLIETEDDLSLWFDITDAYNMLRDNS
jgi:hypothetical protein